YCASCHRPDLRGNPPEFPSLVDAGTRRSVDEVDTVVRDGAGRMPGHSELHPTVRRAIVDYVLTGTSSEVSDQPTPFDMKYMMDGYVRFTDPDGFSAVPPPCTRRTASSSSSSRPAAGRGAPRRAAHMWRLRCLEHYRSPIQRRPSAATSAGISWRPSNSRNVTSYPIERSRGTITRLHSSMGRIGSDRPCDTKNRGCPCTGAGMTKPGENAATRGNRSPLARPSEIAYVAPSEKPPTVTRAGSTASRANTWSRA